MGGGWLKKRFVCSPGGVVIWLARHVGVGEVDTEVEVADHHLVEGLLAPGDVAGGVGVKGVVL